MLPEQIHHEARVVKCGVDRNKQTQAIAGHPCMLG